jgi:hypothetical protein
MERAARKSCAARSKLGLSPVGMQISVNGLDALIIAWYSVGNGHDTDENRETGGV